MAIGTIILRPSQDISVKHKKSKGKKGFSLISETTADNDATYISQNINSTSSTSVTSTFKVSGTLPKENYKITGITLYVSSAAAPNASISSCKVEANISYKGTFSNSPISSTNITEGYSVLKNSNIQQFSDVFSLINADIKKNNKVSFFNDIILRITTSGSKMADEWGKTHDPFNINITQAYLEISYSTIDGPTPISEKFYLKENGSYIQYTSVYKKNNGSWQKISFSEVFPNLTNGTKTNFVKKI